MLTLCIVVFLIGLLMLDIPVVVAIGMTAVSFFVFMGQDQLLAMLPPFHSFGFLAGVIAVVVGVPLLAAGLLWGGVIEFGSKAPDAIAQSAIVFDGGGAQYDHDNPESASLVLIGGTEASEISWEITDAGSGQILYSDAGSTAREVFSLLPDGAYKITFRWKSEDGASAAIKTNFQILRMA